MEYEAAEHFQGRLQRKERTCGGRGDWAKAGGGYGASTVPKSHVSIEINKEMGRK